MGATVRRILNILMGKGSAQAVQYLAGPALNGAGAGGVALTAGAGAWGAYADLIAAGAVTVEFWVCGLLVDTLSGIQILQAQLYNATATRTLGSFQVDATATTINAGNLNLPGPVYCNANDQIQGRVGGAAAKSVNAHVIYAIGL